MFGRRGTNHICSSPIQPEVSTGISLTTGPNWMVAVGTPDWMVEVAEIAVAVSATDVPWNATWVPVMAVAVSATDVAVSATPGGNVGVPAGWAATLKVSARKACASDVSGSSFG